MDREIKNCILEGYEEIKKDIYDNDKDKITNMENSELCFDEIEAVSAYYESEYEETMCSNPRDKVTIHKSAYSVIKTLMHLRYISTDNDKVDKIHKGGERLPLGLLYANEFFCWNVVMRIYDVFRKEIGLLPESEQDTKEWPPYCELHFEKTRNSVVATFIRARNRLSDITPGYIHILFELLLQKHKNISAELVGKLLNRSGFKTFLTFWGQKTATIGLMYCDLDKFKQVNDDNTNHEVGDEILRKVADVLSATCEKHNGITARVGGEEFCLAFNYPDQNVNVSQKLNQIYTEIRQELQKIERPNAKEECIEYKKYMTMSVAGGIAPLPSGYDHKNIENWFGQLDEVVYSIKESGRDDYRFVQLSLMDVKNKPWEMSAEEEG
jgi:diguanylate cyclase (GGDEF)-like protein